MSATMNGPREFHPLGTREGWAAFANQAIPTPRTMTAAEHKRMTDEQRAEFADERIRYMTSAAVVRTPQLTSIMQAARRMIHLNEYRHYGKLGLIISGEAALGKTTIVARIGREHERRRREQHHPSGADGAIPVVYVTVPPACNAKAMLAQFAVFYGLPLTPRSSHTEMMTSVSYTMSRSRTELVIVDEIHNLNLNFRQSAEASDALKQLSEKCPATFIYAGINLDSNGLLDGTRGQQIASRFDLHTVTPFTYRTQRSREDWETLLVEFEATLNLVNQPEGGILRYARALHAHTNGSIGRLSHTLHGCALTAIDGPERLNDATLRRQGIAFDRRSPAA